MRRVLATVTLVGLAIVAQAQQELRRFEIGAQSTMLRTMGEKDYREIINGEEFNIVCTRCRTPHVALGPAFSFHLNRYFALDASFTFFPHSESRVANWANDLYGGWPIQALAGLKTTLYRSRRFTVFARTRPGFVSWSHAELNVQFAVPELRRNYGRKTYFAFDVGGGIEYAVAPRLALRFDAGDTVIRWNYLASTPSELGFFATRPFSTHNLQTSAGIYYRFGPSVESEVPRHTPQILSRLELGTQVTMLRTRGDILGCYPWSTTDTGTVIFGGKCPTQQWAIGPAFTFNLDSHFALDGAFSFFPAKQGSNVSSSFPSPIGPTSGYGGHLSEALVGLKASLRSSRFTLFAKARPGLVHWTKSLTDVASVNDPPTSFNDLRFTFAPTTSFAMDLGGGVEYAYTPSVAFRVEVGSTMIWWSGAPGKRDNLQTSSGVFYRFGRRVEWQRPRATEKPHRFFDALNISIMTAGLLAQTADSIATQRNQAACHKWNTAPNHEIACAAEEANPITRPFVRRGWAGQVSLIATVATGQTLIQYAVHRMGYHRVERAIPIPLIIGNVHGARSNLEHPYRIPAADQHKRTSTIGGTWIQLWRSGTSCSCSPETWTPIRESWMSCSKPET